MSCHLDQMKKNSEPETTNKVSESQEVQLLEEVIPLEPIKEERTVGQYFIVNKDKDDILGDVTHKKCLGSQNQTEI